MPARFQQFHLIIPTGTKVVSRHDRRVGVVVHAPATLENAYRVRFADGEEASFRRVELTIFRQDQEFVSDQLDHSELYRFVAYSCIVGSTAYGLTTEISDVDRRGFYLPPAEVEWSLAGVPPQLENDNEEVYWELEKFLRLASERAPASARPNALSEPRRPSEPRPKEAVSFLSALSVRTRFLSRARRKRFPSSPLYLSERAF